MISTSPSNISSTSSGDRPRVRAFHNKVKSGCQTCKARRVKCTEERPNCARCLSSGRDCVYATHPRAKVFESFQPSRPKPDELIPLKPAIFVSSSPEETRALEFFLKVSAPAASTYNVHTKEFFERLIPQVAQSEAAVRHLIVAVAARQESMSSSADNAVTLSRVQTKHYIAGINALTRDKHSGEEAVLLASALFIVLGQMEAPEDQTAQCMFHLMAGMRILIERLAQKYPRSSSIVDVYVRPVFARLEMMTSIFMVPTKGTAAITCNVEPQMPVLPDEFSNLQHARKSWFEIVCWRYNKQARSQPWTVDSASFREIRSLMLKWNELLMKHAGRVALGAPEELQRTLAMISQFRLLFLAMMFSVRHDLWMENLVQPTFVNLLEPGEVSMTYHLPQRVIEMIPEMDWEAAPYDDEMRVRLWPLVDALRRSDDAGIMRLAFRL